MRAFLFIVTVIAVSIGEISTFPSAVEVVVSNGAGKRLQRAGVLEWRQGFSGPRGVVVDRSRQYQRIDGFGGSFLRSGALALSTLPPVMQDKVMDALFDPIHGAGLSVGKVPIGACDYCPISATNMSWWSYRDKPSDSFSLGPDLLEPGGTIPYIRRAASRMLTPPLLQATLDYHPDWMLFAGKLPQATLNPKYYPEAAQYYLDYATEFARHAGFPLEYISFFNEPHDSYTWITLPENAEFLVNYVGPLFRRHQGAPKFTYATQSSRNTTYNRTPKILQMRDVLNYTDVLFYHGYDCNPWICHGGHNATCPQLGETAKLIQEMHAAYPSLKLWMTEVCYAQEYGNWSPPPACPGLPFGAFEDSLQWGKMIIADMNSFSSAWIYWNMILDTKGGPHLTSERHNDPKIDIQQPLVIVDAGAFVLTGAYYALAHFGRYVTRGTVRIGIIVEHVSVNIYVVAFFDDQTGTVILNCVNDSPHSNDIIISDSSFNNTHFQVSLDAVSITTLRYRVK